MKRLYAFGFASMIFLACPVFTYAEPDVQEGNWETVIEMKMEGMPFPMPPMKTTSCVTKKDMIPSTAQKGQECKINEQKMIGNKVTWKGKCADKDGTLESEGEITYSGSSYQGTMKAKSIPKDKNAQPLNMSYKLSGRRLGGCKK